MKKFDHLWIFFPFWLLLYKKYWDRSKCIHVLTAHFVFNSKTFLQKKGLANTLFPRKSFPWQQDVVYERSHTNHWCNVNPDKITKWDQLWFKGLVSIILNPFLRVFAISAFLKVIHAPKTSHFRYPQNNLPTYIFSNPYNQDFPKGI